MTRRLPQLESIRAFEVIARLGSFKRAGDELNVTPSALSHRIADLEADLGVLLFTRHVRRVELTLEGERLSAGVRRALLEIQSTIASVARNERTRLRVTAIPSHAVRWLAPRLHRFRKKHPETEIDINADLAVVDLSQRTVDIALRFGGGHYPAVKTEWLMADAIFPVVSPDYLAANGPVRDQHDVLRLFRILDTTAENDESGANWRHWFERNNLPLDTVGDGMNLNGTLLAVEAAASGLGVAIARKSLVESDLRTGRLVRLLTTDIPTNWNHYVVVHPSISAWEPARSFINWLKAEAGDSAGAG
ncbi:LysR substrate-binding domain-containing protein [Mesorhizobium sp. RSR565B]|uniref:LysR substrate-binding domain-containing protein n=1 Tax=unclassified Mesorhizobium TaxID=325217 RepID=UPI0003CDDE98|nr:MULTISPECIES: LysR substrate-binding domain-containing protein [unclassified Mesorhizobium]ESX84119.1 XRE family transcriptional regulator [Mesorhizobium sp. LSHC412B00]ESY03637.1 XRE family transcriptional regulator [Mesorhizobium sp. LNJC399B00]ESZ52557.1 XRE family transcriptional regulator [Mesorhizobium sp. L103C565B0]WJI68931.1 LysR substrate-binding domain-containing protein [Mesorhizobium sp. C399B]